MPDGTDESANVVLSQHGEPRDLGFQPGPFHRAKKAAYWERQRRSTTRTAGSDSDLSESDLGDSAIPLPIMARRGNQMTF